MVKKWIGWKRGEQVFRESRKLARQRATAKAEAAPTEANQSGREQKKNIATKVCPGNERCHEKLQNSL